MPGGFNKSILIHVHNPEEINRRNENKVRFKQAFCIEIISVTGDGTIVLLETKPAYASMCLK